MTKINKRIEIVSSAHLDLSQMSQRSRQAIEVVLAKHYADVRICIVNSLADLEALVVRQPDLVFLGMECLPIDQDLGLMDPNKIWLAEYFDERGIIYTGSCRAAIEIGRDKSLAKQGIHEAGLNTAPFLVVRRNQLLKTEQLPSAFPLFVKPVSRGGGAGIDSDSIVYDLDQLKAKVLTIAIKHHSDSLVEEYLPGREFSVAILKCELSTGYSVMPIELIAPLDRRGARLLSAEVKNADTERSIEVTDEATKLKVCKLAIDVFHALGARDYGRIDIRMDEFGTPHFLEANLIPSLKRSDGNYFPKACHLSLNLDYDSMILRIVRLALDRAPKIIEDLSKSVYADGFLPILEAV